MPSRKASCSVMGSHSLPPSSPMVSSANNPNKSEIPDRRKDMTATTVLVLAPFTPARSNCKATYDVIWSVNLNLWPGTDHSHWLIYYYNYSLIGEYLKNRF